MSKLAVSIGLLVGALGCSRSGLLALDALADDDTEADERSEGDRDAGQPLRDGGAPLGDDGGARDASDGLTDAGPSRDAGVAADDAAIPLDGEVPYLAFSGSGKVMMARADRLEDVRTVFTAASFPAPNVSSVQYARGGEVMLALFSAEQQWRLYAWYRDAPEGTGVHELLRRSYEAGPPQVFVSPGGRYVMLVDIEALPVIRLDASGPVELDIEIEPSDTVRIATMSADDRYLLYAKQGSLLLADLESAGEPAVLFDAQAEGPARRLTRARLSPDGTHAIYVVDPPESNANELYSVAIAAAFEGEPAVRLRHPAQDYLHLEHLSSRLIFAEARLPAGTETVAFDLAGNVVDAVARGGLPLYCGDVVLVQLDSGDVVVAHDTPSGLERVELPMPAAPNTVPFFSPSCASIAYRAGEDHLGYFAVPAPGTLPGDIVEHTTPGATSGQFQSSALGDYLLTEVGSEPTGIQLWREGAPPLVLPDAEFGAIVLPAGDRLIELERRSTYERPRERTLAMTQLTGPSAGERTVLLDPLVVTNGKTLSPDRRYLVLAMQRTASLDGNEALGGDGFYELDLRAPGGVSARPIPIDLVQVTSELYLTKLPGRRAILINSLTELAQIGRVDRVGPDDGATLVPQALGEPALAVQVGPPIVAPGAQAFALARALRERYVLSINTLREAPSDPADVVQIDAEYGDEIVAFGPDPRSLIVWSGEGSAGRTKIARLDLERGTREVVASALADQFIERPITRESGRLFYIHYDGALGTSVAYVHDPGDGEPRALNGPELKVIQLWVSADGTWISLRLVAAQSDGLEHLQVLEESDGWQAHTLFSAPEGQQVVCFENERGSGVLATEAYVPSARLWRRGALATPSELSAPGERTPILLVAHDGSRVMFHGTIAGDTALYAYRVDAPSLTLERIADSPTHRPLLVYAQSLDQRYLLTKVWNGGPQFVIDLTGEQPPLELPASVQNATFDSSSRYLVFSSSGSPSYVHTRRLDRPGEPQLLKVEGYLSQPFWVE